MRGALCPLGRFRLGDPVWFRGDPCLQSDSVDPHACFSFLSFHSIVQEVWFSASFFQIGLRHGAEWRSVVHAWGNVSSWSFPSMRSCRF